MDDKVIVTNLSALQAKYGKTGVRSVVAAVRRLIRADKKRGLATRLVGLDDAKAMKQLGAPPVTSVSDCRQNKAAIDAVWKACSPDYLMILGATDVVPHQDPINPAFVAGDDDDRFAYGDLPYACESGYSRRISKFMGPTRVVSRLPDLCGAKTPQHLIELLGHAARAVPRPPSQYASGFALSARIWRASTELSVYGVLGPGATTRLAPSEGPTFTKDVLGSRVHFINCHGAPADPTFYGQQGDRFPLALTTRSTARKVVPGTVVAAECCYGAELYDAETLAIPIPICQSYLAQGALAYLGSTTIAYGPAEGNGSADLITQYFLIHLLAGASVGRAALMARQEFVAQTGQMDAIDLKTLAQFCVYGDPSVCPVDVPNATHHLASTHAAEGAARRERRAKLAVAGEQLLRSKPFAEQTSAAKVSPQAVRSLANIARKAGVESDGFVAYEVNAKRAKTTSGKHLRQPDRYHVLIRPRGKQLGPADKIAIVATESASRITSYRIYYSH